MRINTIRLAWLSIWVLLAASSFAFAADEPVNVAGTWKIAVAGQSGSAEQTIVLKQDGNKITVHVNTRVALDYKGTVDGDSMKGKMTGKGKSGEWAAKREK